MSSIVTLLDKAYCINYSNGDAWPVLVLLAFEVDSMWPPSFIWKLDFFRYSFVTGFLDFCVVPFDDKSITDFSHSQETFFWNCLSLLDCLIISKAFVLQQSRQDPDSWSKRRRRGGCVYPKNWKRVLRVWARFRIHEEAGVCRIGIRNRPGGHGIESNRGNMAGRVNFALHL